MTDDTDFLQQLVEVWHGAALDVLALLRGLDTDEWDLPTDLPGWDVRAVASHLAHLESELAGNHQDRVEVPEAPHVRGLLGQFTEAGPLARRSWTTARVVDELQSSVEKRYAELRADPPSDGSALAPGFAGLIGWSWHTLLTNRPVDLWMHDQDIRRATGRRGALDTPAAGHVAGVFAAALPFVLGKKVGAEPGTSAVLRVTGAQRRVVAAAVGEDRRGVPLAGSPANPTVEVTLDFEDWVVLCGGRRRRHTVPVTVAGDEALAARLLDDLAVTP